MKKDAIILFSQFVISVDCCVIVIICNTVCNFGETTFIFLYFQFWHFPLVLICFKCQSNVFDHLWLFSQNMQPNLDWKYGNYRTERLKNATKKIFHLPWLRKNPDEKNKRTFSNQSGDVIQTSISFTNYRRWCWMESSELSFWKTNPLWSTRLVKLQAFIPQF